MVKKRLGELLVESKLLTTEQLRGALSEQRYNKQPLGRVVVSLGLVSELKLVDLLSHQLNLPAVSLEQNPPTPDALELLDLEFCQGHCCIPFAFQETGHFLDVAMADPTNQNTFDEIRVKTRCNVRPYLAGPRAIDAAILAVYGRPLTGEFPIGNFVDPASISVEDNDPSAAFIVDRPLTDLVPGSTDADDQGDDITIDVDETAATPATGPEAINVADALTAPLDFGPTQDAQRDQAQRGLQEEMRLEQEETRLELQQLRAMVERDEHVLLQLLALLVEKGVCSHDELTARISTSDDE